MRLSGTQTDAEGPATSAYFSRRLAISDASILDNSVDETALLTLAGNTIVLGEPGMGKSELMRELGRRLGVEMVTAVRLIAAKNPAKFVPDGKPLLIDGLDEAMSRREGDAIDAILAQLDEAGAPPFILSCRSREWQARTVTNLRQIYGADPRLATLEPFRRSGARDFLAIRYPAVDANHVLEHLEAHNLADLYRNPLTLGLMGRVAESDTQLPATRAALFERVCMLVWPEHDPDRQDLGLAQLGEEEALDAAGAIAAALLFAGAEAASIAGAAQVQPGDVRLVDIEKLVTAKTVQPIFSSKLFHSVGPSRAKPIHRVVAEYLGARWLARQAATPRTQRRLLAQLQGSGGVPSSLRGLHAWLAYHSPSIAERVVAADPFGLIRYGETAALTPHLADCLFEALSALAEVDPFFRAADWDSKTAAGLMTQALEPKIRKVIESAGSNSHFRSLLIEGLDGTALAGELAGTLESILLSPERFYRERHDAADALSPHRDRIWWQQVIARLIEEGSEDAPRLARQLIEQIDADVPDALLVATLFAEMGTISCPLPREKRRRVHTARHYDRLLDMIDAGHLVGVLDLVVDYSDLLHSDDWQNANDVADIVAHLIVRAIDESAIGIEDAPTLWRWLAPIEQAMRFHHDIKKTLAERLAASGPLRRAVQDHVFQHDRRKDSLWVTEMYLQRRLVGLSTYADDLVGAFDRLAQGKVHDQALRQDWKDLVRLGWGGSGPDPMVRAAAEKFRRGDAQLAIFIGKVENPKKPAWEVKQEKDGAKRAKKRAITFEAHRRDFSAASADMRAGEFSAIFQPAEAYFGRYHDLSSDLAPADRIAEWLGDALRDDALMGFEATLHRTDLPTMGEIAAGFAQGTTYNYCYPIMAGLYERLRIGIGFNDLPDPIVTTGLLLSHSDRGWKIEADQEALRKALDARVIPTIDARKDFAKTWIEPSLAAGATHVEGLYKLARDPEWQMASGALAAGWLASFPNVPESVEAGLVDCLIYGDALDALRGVAEARVGTVFRHFDHMLSWLAIDVLVRFDAVRPDLDGIGMRNPEFIWFLRNRLQFERRGGILPLSIEQAEWIVATFRAVWPYATLEGSGSGDTNPYDATDCLRAMIDRIADDTSIAASEGLQRLAEPVLIAGCASGDFQSLDGVFLARLQPLKRKAHPKHVLQLVLYSDLLAEIQGVMPERAHVQLGDGTRATLRLADYAHYARGAQAKLEAFVASPEPTRPIPCADCSLCRWADHCDAVLTSQDSLFQVANITRGQVKKLEASGIETMAALARHDGPVRGVASATAEKLVGQARLQHARKTGEPAFELRPAQPGKGFDLLPRPQAGDLFYDIEGDPHYEGGLEYLHGVWADDGFHAFWAHDHAAEAQALERLLAFFRDRLTAYPEARIYHYAPYEITALRRLTTRYGIGEAFLDRLMRERRFVDLYAVVRGALIASEPSYSIKALEAFYGLKREGEVKTAGGSVVAYENWRETGDQQILDEIEDYNRPLTAQEAQYKQREIERLTPILQKHGVVPGRDPQRLPGRDRGQNLPPSPSRCEDDRDR
ncbi:hypothetical protein TomTYG45_38150 [Sphingobium sp. TomTYG45]